MRTDHNFYHLPIYAGNPIFFHITIAKEKELAKKNND